MTTNISRWEEAAGLMMKTHSPAATGLQQDSIEIEQLEFDLYYHDKLGI